MNYNDIFLKKLLIILMHKQNHIDRNADITVSCVPVGDRFVIFYFSPDNFILPVRSPIIDFFFTVCVYIYSLNVKYLFDYTTLFR